MPSNKQAELPFPLSFLDAVIAGDAEEVRRCVKAMESSDQVIYARRGVGAKKMAPLHIAAQMGHVEVVKVLLEAKADVSQADSQGFTALHHAAQNSNSESDSEDGNCPFVATVNALIAAQADVDADHGAGTPLCVCLSPSVASALVAAGANVNYTVNEQSSDQSTALIAAAESGPIELLRIFVEAKADVNVVGAYGSTALHKAAVRSDDDPAFVQALIDAGANVSASDFVGCSALHYAVTAANNAKTARALALGGAPLVEFQDENEHKQPNPLKSAISYNNFGIVAVLGNVEGVDSTALDPRDRNPLVAAAALDDDVAVRALIEANNTTASTRSSADFVNALTTGGQTALMAAAEHGSIRAFFALLEAGADPHLADSQGFTALSHVKLIDLKNKNTSAVAPKPLNNNRDNEGEHEQHSIATQMFQRLLSVNVQADVARRRKRLKLLASAVVAGDVPAVKALIAGGVPMLSLVDKADVATLKHAAQSANPDLLTSLVQHVKNEDRSTPSGEFPASLVIELLHAAVMTDAAAAIPPLLEVAGAESRSLVLEGKDYRSGHTPLIAAVKRNAFTTVRALIAAGADVNGLAADEKTTPLAMAAQGGHLYTAHCILSSSQCDVDLCSSIGGGLTPLHIASQRCDAAMIRLLIGAGASVAARDAEGATPLFWCVLGVPALPASGGFGGAFGGIFAPPAAGFGAPAPPAAGFGAPALTAAGFGAPAPTAAGFGAAAAGFGAPAPAAAGFGAPAPTAAGFGSKGPPAAGFGAPALTAAGFGAPAPAAAGFGRPNARGSRLSIPGFGFEASVRALLNGGANINDSSGTWPGGAVSIAAKNGEDSMVSFLTSVGATICE